MPVGDRHVRTNTSLESMALSGRKSQTIFEQLSKKKKKDGKKRSNPYPCPRPIWLPVFQDWDSKREVLSSNKGRKRKKKKQGSAAFTGKLQAVWAALSAGTRVMIPEILHFPCSLPTSKKIIKVMSDVPWSLNLSFASAPLEYYFALFLQSSSSSSTPTQSVNSHIVKRKMGWQGLVLKSSH